MGATLAGGPYRLLIGGAWTEGSAGPVVVTIPFDDDDEGIAMANDGEFGLYASTEVLSVVWPG
jgi:hypothetical protein